MGSSRDFICHHLITTHADILSLHFKNYKMYVLVFNTILKKKLISAVHCCYSENKSKDLYKSKI